MANKFRKVLEDNDTIVLPCAASVALEIGDLLLWDNSANVVSPASSQADQGSEAANQNMFADVFAGVCLQQRLAEQATAGEVVVATRIVADYPCPSTTWEIGDLVGASEDSGNDGLEDQQLERVTNPANALGVCIKRTTGAVTTVRAALFSRWAFDLAHHRSDVPSGDSLAMADDDAASFGTGLDALLLWSTGDASNHSFVMALGDSNQALHITDNGASATDWNVSADTHPTVYIHSNTTPATDYLLIGAHDGTTANIDVAGGTTLAFKIAGTTQANLTAAGMDFIDDNGITLGTGLDAFLTWSTGDASDHSVVLALGDTSQMLHITDLAAAGTDWNITSPTHPTLYIHSNTTPITDYLLIGTHDGTSALIDVAGGTTLDIKTSGTSRMTVVSGQVFINDTSNADVTTGLTVNQGAADDQIFALKSSDVAHGVTTLAETDSYLTIRKNAATEGAPLVQGFGTAQQGMVLYGVGTTADTTDAPTTSSEAIFEIRTALANGTGVQASGATGNIFQVMNTTTNEFIVKGDGEIYSNQSATVGTFDDHDDALMCADLSYQLSNEYEKVIGHNRELFNRLGILADNTDGTPGGMFSVTKLNMLCLCAIGQIGRQIQAIASHVGLQVKGEEVKLLPAAG